MPVNISAPVQHVFDTIMQLTDAEITKVKQLKYTTWSSITRRLRRKQLQKELDNKDISMGIYKCFVDWMHYFHEYEPGQEVVMNLDDSLYDGEDMDDLERKYDVKFGLVQAHPPPATTPPLSSPTTRSTSFTISNRVPPSRVKSSDINTIGFLKHTNFRLRDKDDILIFYRDVYQQGQNYNVHITKIDDVTNVPRPTVPISIPDLAAIGTTADCLYQKFRQEKVIDDDFSLAHNLLDTTSDGYEFLFQLLRLVHSNLMLKSSATQDIPKFSDYKDIYKYARGIKEYQKQHNIAKRTFTDKEITTMFLDHLDHPCFRVIVSTISTQIRNLSIIPQEYIVPALATTIDQSIDIPPMTSRSNPYSNPGRINQIYDDDIDYMLDDLSLDDDINGGAYINSLNNQRPENPYLKRRSTQTTSTFPPGIPLRPEQPRTTPWRRVPRSRQPSRSQSPNLRQRNPQGFPGKCLICGVRYHHAENCFFLMKVKQALTYLAADPSSAKTKRAQFQNDSSYENTAATVRSLQDNNFIPYDGPVDALLDVVSPDLFIPETTDATISTSDSTPLE